MALYFSGSYKMTGHFLLLVITEYMNFNRGCRKWHSNKKSHNFDDQYRKKYWICHPEFFCGLFVNSWLSKTIRKFNPTRRGQRSNFKKITTTCVAVYFCGSYTMKGHFLFWFSFIYLFFVKFFDKGHIFQCVMTYL